MMPKRIQMRRTKGWRKPEGAIYVGRPTKWGNPFRVGDDHSYYAGPDAKKATPAQCAMLFREHYAADIAASEVGLAILRTELRGHDLACWCKLCARHKDGKPFDEPCADCAPCHGDVLGELAAKPPTPPGSSS